MLIKRYLILGRISTEHTAADPHQLHKQLIRSEANTLMLNTNNVQLHCSGRQQTV